MGQPKEHHSRYEAKTNSAVLLPKGELGKTADPLMGCMVPIILYPGTAILGHFGRVAVGRAQSDLEPLLSNLPKRQNPSAALMFHLDIDHDDEYKYRINLMREAVAETVGIRPEHIALRYYDDNSEIVVDWRMRLPRPIIYVHASPEIDS